MIKYLPNMFGQLITQTDKYFLEKGILISSGESRRYYSDTKLEDLTIGYESFQEEVDKVNAILKEIHESRLNSVFNKINKNVKYETYKLGIFYKTQLNWELIEGNVLKKLIDLRLKDLSYMTNDFIQLQEVWRGVMKKEKLEEKFKNNSCTLTYENFLEYKEKELAQEMLKFKEFLHVKLEDALFHHIVLEQYIVISHKNTRLNLLRVLLSFFGTK